MNIFSRVLHGPAPDPIALAQGLTAIRVGWGRYVYSGIPHHVRARTRREPDDLDRLACEAAGMPLPDPVPDVIEPSSDHSEWIDCGTVDHREVA